VGPDFARFFSYATLSNSTHEISEGVKKEKALLTSILRNLSPEDRADLLAATGDSTDMIKQLIED
jgi:hypothetical protein